MPDRAPQALALRIDEMSAASDKMIRVRLKKPFGLLPDALAQYTTAVMPERIAKTEPTVQITAKNMGQYAAKLSEGTQALLKKFPDRFRVDVYPFGGVKSSGVGREGIRYAIEEMSQMKFIGIKP